MDPTACRSASEEKDELLEASATCTNLEYASLDESVHELGRHLRRIDVQRPQLSAGMLPLVVAKLYQSVFGDRALVVLADASRQEESGEVLCAELADGEVVGDRKERNAAAKIHCSDVVERSEQVRQRDPTVLKD